MIDIFCKKKITLEHYKAIARIPLLSTPKPKKKRRNNSSVNIPMNLRIDTRDLAFEVFWAHWNHRTIHIQEQFMVLYLTDNLNAIGIGLESEGSFKRCSTDIMHIIFLAIRNGAKKIITAHNHPRNSLNASNSDIELFKELRNITTKYEIELITNFIITSKRKYNCYQ